MDAMKYEKLIVIDMSSGKPEFTFSADLVPRDINTARVTMARAYRGHLSKGHAFQRARRREELKVREKEDAEQRAKNLIDKKPPTADELKAMRTKREEEARNTRRKKQAEELKNVRGKPSSGAGSIETESGTRPKPAAGAESGAKSGRATATAGSGKK